ncbi:MAG: hypothetical protein PF517_08860 [Salinivirgaceae bacterium]|nr:hypothetical protein [Salinivirgaceae bacterium]
MRHLFIITFILLAKLALSQVDSVKLVKYSPGFRFNDGIYLSHQQLLNNSPIPIKRIVSKYNKAGFDFFDMLLSEEKVTYYDQFGMKKIIDVNRLWGFCRRGSVYINWGDDFNRIPVMGSACHFIATVTVYEDRYNNPNYGYGYYNVPTTTSRTEIYQFVMNFRTGDIFEYTVANVLLLLMVDTELYDAYNALRKKKKKQMKFLYLRKFNEKHPLYIPIN